MTETDVSESMSSTDYNLGDWELEELGCENILELSSPVSQCLVCGIGNVILHKRNQKKMNMLVYGRNGTYSALHEEFICNNQNTFKPCRASYFHSYYKHNGKRIYYDNALKQRVLVTSSQSGFDVDYLVELTSFVETCSANFEGLAKCYNRLHNRKLPMDMMKRRT